MSRTTGSPSSVTRALNVTSLCTVASGSVSTAMAGARFLAASSLSRRPPAERAAVCHVASSQPIARSV